MSTTNEKKLVMKRYGITCEVKFVYTYKNFKYDNLEQAVNYATLTQENPEKSKSK